MEKEKIRTLRELEIGESVQVVAVGGEDQLRKHLLDMGLIPGTYVKLVKFAPSATPCSSPCMATSSHCDWPTPSTFR